MRSLTFSTAAHVADAARYSDADGVERIELVTETQVECGKRFCGILIDMFDERISCPKVDEVVRLLHDVTHIAMVTVQ